MRIVLILALLLAGCATAPATNQLAGPETAGQEEAAPPTPAKAERVMVTWYNVTYQAICLAPLPTGQCVGENHDFSEKRLTGIGWDLWLNFTWQANHEANRELTVSYGSNETTGPSPLLIHVERPEEDLVVTARGQRTTFLVGYQDAPPQEFAATASFIPRTVQVGA